MLSFRKVRSLTMPWLITRRYFASLRSVAHYRAWTKSLDVSRWYSTGQNDGDEEGQVKNEKSTTNDVNDDEHSPKTTPQIPPSLSQKFVPFDAEKPSTILDYHEELYGLRWDSKHAEKEMESRDDFYLYRRRKSLVEKVSTFSTARGKHGVFDIEDLVAALKSEKVADLSVVRVPKEANYTDYLVMVTCKNKRHLNSTIGFIRKLYKIKRLDTDPQLSQTIGTKDDSNWLVLDMGYIVVHFFHPGVREVYDLESLWCVGLEFDEKTVRPTYSEEIDIMERHLRFIESMALPPPSPPSEIRPATSGSSRTRKANSTPSTTSS